ncbi:type I-C CRISPR-associated protein Cas8c/Csd1 [Desulfoplanes sp.]
MILQALDNYYHRLAEDENKDISEFGFGKQGVHFCLTINQEGVLLGNPMDLRDEKGKPLKIEVPGPVNRANKVTANFAWDNTGYVLGVDDKGKPERTAKTNKAFKSLVAEVLGDVEDDGAVALNAFLESWNPEDANALMGWDGMLDSNIVFRLDGDRAFLHERRAFRNAWSDYLAKNGSHHTGMCLVTGKVNTPIPNTHPKIKGVPGAQTAGASLVSFNFDSAVSFGKKQNLNAPISEQVAFAYTTALNNLLAPGSNRKVQIGDTTTLFWTDSPTPAETFFGLSVGGKSAEDKGLAKEIEQFLDAVSKGDCPEELGNPEIPFYILGLSPNAARISVRFWNVSTVGSIARNIGKHFNALELKRSFESEPKHPRPWWLLKELAPQRDSRNISPLLSGQLLRAIVQNQPYPRTLLTAVITRIRADKEINYLRACVLKAYLTRNAKQEISMALDKQNRDIGYRLGRLFAIVERIQEDAVPGSNSTVRDRFFGSASATPGRTFPIILRNVQHGIAKIRKTKMGWAVTLEKLIQEILEEIDSRTGFPATLDLKKQGMFVLGYYQQRQDLFTKKTDKVEE